MSVPYWLNLFPDRIRVAPMRCTNEKIDLSIVISLSQAHISIQWLEIRNVDLDNVCNFDSFLSFIATSNAVTALNLVDCWGSTGQKRRLMATIGNNTVLSSISVDGISHVVPAGFAWFIQHRNTVSLPNMVRQAALSLIAFRLRPADQGTLACFPKEIVRLISQTVWKTRTDRAWLHALDI